MINSVKLLSNQKLVLFVSSGKVFSINPNDIPSGNSNPKSFVYFVDSIPNDKVVGILPSDCKKIFIASKNGKGFKSDIDYLITNQRKGKQFFNLKNNDKLIKVFSLNKSHIICVSKFQKMLVFDVLSVPELQKGVGVQLMKIKDKDYLSDIMDINITERLEWVTGSKTRKIDNIKFWLGKRAQTGKKIPKFFNKDLKFND